MNRIVLFFGRVQLAVLFLMALLSALPLPAMADQLTLAECLTLALQNNLSLKTSAVERQIARYGVQQAQSAMYPRIDGHLGYTMQLDPQAVIIGGRIAETQEPDFLFGGLSAYYTMYDFGRRAAVVEQAERGAEASRFRYKADQSDLALQVIESYFSILQLEKRLETARQEEQQLVNHRAVAQALYDNGVVTRNDILQADVRLASVQQKILTLASQKRNSWYLLNMLTGKNQDFKADLDDKTNISSKIVDASLEDTVLPRRGEIMTLGKAAERAAAAVTESRRAFYPELYGRLSLDYVQNSMVREQTIMAATVGLKVNFFDGFASSATQRKATLEHARAQAALADAAEKVKLEIVTTRNDMVVAQEKLSVAETSIIQGKENLRINEERYKERVGTATEVLDAQTLLAQAQNDYYQALYQLQVVKARYQKAIGNLL